jgi:hypothetical protein
MFIGAEKSPTCNSRPFRRRGEAVVAASLRVKPTRKFGLDQGLTFSRYAGRHARELESSRP